MLEFAVRLVSQTVRFLFVLRRRLTREYFCATLERIFAVRIGVTASSADGASSMRLRQCDRPSADDTNGGGKNGTPPVFSVDQSYLISKSSGVDGSLREETKLHHSRSLYTKHCRACREWFLLLSVSL